MARPNRSSDSRRYMDWIVNAKLDSLAAQLLAADERCYPAAAFHCQQAIEKALKGYLLFKTGRLHDGHNLTWLCKQAVRQNGVFSRWLEPTSKINRYYIETRYPADLPLDVSTSSIQKILHVCGEILELIFSEIREDYTAAVEQMMEKSESAQTE